MLKKYKVEIALFNGDWLDPEFKNTFFTEKGAKRVADGFTKFSGFKTRVVKR